MSPSLQSAVLSFLAALTVLASEAESALLAPHEESHGQPLAPPAPPVVPLQNETAADFVARGGTPGPIPAESIFVGWAIPNEG